MVEVPGQFTCVLDLNAIMLQTRDYHGWLVTNMGYHRICPNCGKPAWYGFIINGICPLCLVNGGRFTMELSFAHSTSKKFHSVIRKIRFHPCYLEVGGRHTLTVYNFADYITYKRFLAEILSVVQKWASFQVLVCGELYNPSFLRQFMNDLDYLYRQGFASI